MPAGRQKTKRLFRFRWWMLPIVLIVGYFGGKSAWEYFEMISGRAPMVHVVAQIQVGDEIVTIDKTLACHRRYFGETTMIPTPEVIWRDYLLIGKRFNYVSDKQLAGAHLENGRALLMALPKACVPLLKAMEKGQKGNISPPSFMPVTAIVDNFEDPQQITMYASKTAYAKEAAEVKILSYVIQAAEPYTFPSPRDEFDWINPDNGPAIYFTLAMIEYTPADTFFNGEAGIQTLSDVNTVTALNEIPGFKYPRRPSLEPRPTMSRTFLPAYPSSKPTKEEQGKDPSVDNFFPATRDGDHFLAEPSERGMLILQRTDSDDDGRRFYRNGVLLGKDQGGNETRRQDKLFYDGVMLNLMLQSIRNGGKFSKKKAPIFYDPETKEIYRFNRGLLILYHDG